MGLIGGKYSYVLVSLTLLALTPRVGHAQFAGSAHDFSSAVWSGGDACTPCHSAALSPGDAALPSFWNHESSTAQYALYRSETISAIPTGLSESSKRCLSCHDGTVSLDAYLGGSGGNSPLEGASLLGSDFRHSHPIGIIWSHQPANGRPLAWASAAGGDMEDGSRWSNYCVKCHDENGGAGGWVASPLSFVDGNIIGCVTCHDPHNEAGFDAMLRVQNPNSELCVLCHFDKD